MPAAGARSIAKAAGLDRYFTGKPCSNGHTAERYVCDGKCVECCKSPSSPIERRRASARESFARHREKRLSKWRERYAQNPEYYRERSRRYDAENREKRAASQKIWKAANPERVKVHRDASRAKRKAAAGRYTADDVSRILQMQKGRCGYCRTPIKDGYEVDHIIALSKGGTNEASNIQLLCRPCNRRKYTKDPIDYAQSIGKLL